MWDKERISRARGPNGRDTEARPAESGMKFLVSEQSARSRPVTTGAEECCKFPWRDPRRSAGRAKHFFALFSRSGTLMLFITLGAKLSGKVYCYRSCLCPCLQRAGGVFLWVCYHDNSKLCASILTKLGLYFVDQVSDHLRLIKFWPSRAPGKEVCGGAKFFGSALLQPACSVCVSLGAFFMLACGKFIILIISGIYS